MDKSHILKTVHLQQLKGMRISNLGMWMGYNLSKGVPFFVKNGV